MVARKQVQRAIESIGCDCICVKDGKEAFRTLQTMAAKDSIYQQLI